MTLVRWCEIHRGVGAPATEAELATIARYRRTEMPGIARAARRLTESPSFRMLLAFERRRAAHGGSRTVAACPVVHDRGSRGTRSSRRVRRAARGQPRSEPSPEPHPDDLGHLLAAVAR
jgi:hypothetical protein